MTYYFVYETINNINGKKYIGYHKTDNLEDGYMGSGKILRHAIKKYGENNFTRTILKFFDTAEEALLYEKQIVTEDIVYDSKYYNICIGGLGGDTPGPAARRHGKKNSVEHRRKLSDARKGRFKGKENPFYGKKHSDETKKKIAEGQIGELSAVYDHDVYEYVNHSSGEVFSGTQYQFRKQYDLCSGNVNKLIKKKIISYKGWTLKGNSIPAKGPSPDDKVYYITNGKENFVGNRQQIKEHLNTREVSRFLTNKTKKCKGWWKINNE